MKFAKYLSSSYASAMIDKKTFELWRKEEISTRAAIIRFRRNNDIPSNIHISEEDFTKWLLSIGWWRFRS